jgi:hypothetical protein
VIPWAALAVIASCGGGAKPDAGPPVFSATLPDGDCILGAQLSDGRCVCFFEGAPTPCGDGCKNLEADDDNCGACGHACAPSTVCYGGQCRPEPVVVHPATPGACGAIDLAVGDGSLFWADAAAKKIMRVPQGGGPAVTFAEDEFSARWLSVRGANVYWVTGATPYVLRSAQTSGGAARTVVMPSGGLGGYAVSADGQTVYYSAANSSSIQKIPAFDPDAPAVDVVELGRGTPHSLAVEGAHLVFANVDTIFTTELVDGEVAICNGSNDSDPEVVVRCKTLGFQGQQQKVVVSDGRVYWVAQFSVVDELVWPDVVQPSSSVGPGFFNISSFAVSGRTIFIGTLVGDPANGTTIQQFSPNVTGPPIRYARHQAAAQAMAVDESHVYWATGDCAIMAQLR